MLLSLHWLKEFIPNLKINEEIAEAFDKTVRGVKTVLTRRGLSCADYTPKAASE